MRHPAGLRPAARLANIRSLSYARRLLHASLAILASARLANIRSLSYARPPGGPTRVMLALCRLLHPAPGASPGTE